MCTSFFLRNTIRSQIDTYTDLYERADGYPIPINTFERLSSKTDATDLEIDKSHYKRIDVDGSVASHGKNILYFMKH
jgi:hypothetical protein